mmetsp:Transcript_31948/g.63308  ORF Transcript_31948/g.63308 Transcript_31948/m.63308 type:complete len:99 (-) Transcript_31948:421-717(-)
MSELRRVEDEKKEDPSELESELGVRGAGAGGMPGERSRDSEIQSEEEEESEESKDRSRFSWVSPSEQKGPAQKTPVRRGAPPDKNRKATSVPPPRSRS